MPRTIKPIETIREALMLSAVALENNPVPEERKRIAGKCREAIGLMESLPLSPEETGSIGGTIGGKARSAAKTQAARLNGAKGGRPRKTVALPETQ